jgi:Sulfatase-modifying factor enzyme 1
MTLGRLSMFAAILATSVAVAGALVRRHHRAGRAPAGPPEVTLAAPASASGTPAAALPSGAPRSEVVERTSADPQKTLEAAPRDVEDPLTDALCPPGMLLADGVTCSARPGRCAARDPAASGSCRRFEAAECRKGQSLRFCVDRYEYPNLEGVVPATMVTFEQARSACEEEDKRLCTDNEWRFACEGREGFELSYGNERDPSACNVGRSSERVRPEELWEARDVSRVLSRVDRRVPSGSMNRCTSPFGAKDMTGNVEEWASGTSGLEAALVGGDSTMPEALCRTLKKTHQTALRSPHAGFRCCRDPLVRTKARPESLPGAGP